MNLVDLRTQVANFNTYKDWRRPANTTIDSIVIHHSGSGTVNADGSPRLEPKEMARVHVQVEGRAHVSYHYAVDRKGIVYYLLDEEISGYHCFLAIPSRQNAAQWKKWNEQFRGGQLINFTSIGINVMGWFDKGRKQNNQAIPDTFNTPSPEQLAALVELVKGIQQRRRIPTNKVEGHSEVLARTGFGATTCPGTLFSMSKFRESLSGVTPPAPIPPAPTPPAPVPSAPTGPVTVPDPAPMIRLQVKNRPLVGLHARNDANFTPLDSAIIRQAKVESLKMMSQTGDAAYEEARRIDPKMEFIVRLYSGRSGKGNEMRPDEFVNNFRDRINQLNQKFGVLKFEIHNEPNHLTGLEGWGQELADAQNFQAWYKQVFAGLRANHPWALLGYPGLAVPHKDLEWLEWNRESIEMSDWLGMHAYWQTPPGQPTTFQSPDWGQRYLKYHDKYPHKLIEITEFGNSNGQTPGLNLSREEQRNQYVQWFTAIMDKPYIGSAHSFLASSPDRTWVDQGFTWGNDGGPFPVVGAVGSIARPRRAPDWFYAFAANVPNRVPPKVTLAFPGSLGNGGRLPWLKNGAARCAISAKWVKVAANGTEEVIEDGKEWLALPLDMVSGDIITFRMSITTPAAPGKYKLRLAVFHHGQQKWLHDLDKATVPDYFATEVVAAPQPQPPAPTPPLPTPTPPPPTPPATKYGALYLATLPTALKVGEKTTISLLLTNTGTRLWKAQGSNPVVVVPQWLTSDGKLVNAQLRTPLPRDVPPNDKLTVNVSVTAPSSAGTYIFKIDMAEEGILFFSEEGIAPMRRQVAISAIPSLPTWGAQWVELRVPAQMAAGSTSTANVRIRNTGATTWTMANVRVAYRWGAAPNPLRVNLTTDVPTGQEIGLGVPLRAPDALGRQGLTLDLWLEGTGWLSVAAPVQRINIVEPTRDLEDEIGAAIGQNTPPPPPPPVITYPIESAALVGGQTPPTTSDIEASPQG